MIVSVFVYFRFFFHLTLLLRSNKGREICIFYGFSLLLFTSVHHRSPLTKSSLVWLSSISNFRSMTVDEDVNVDVDMDECKICPILCFSSIYSFSRHMFLEMFPLDRVLRLISITVPIFARSMLQLS